MRRLGVPRSGSRSIDPGGSVRTRVPRSRRSPRRSPPHAGTRRVRGWPRARRRGRCGRHRVGWARSSRRRTSDPRPRLMRSCGRAGTAASERVLLPSRRRDPDRHRLGPRPTAEGHDVPQAVVRLNRDLVVELSVMEKPHVRRNPHPRRADLTWSDPRAEPETLGSWSALVDVDRRPFLRVSPSPAPPYEEERPRGWRRTGGTSSGPTGRVVRFVTAEPIGGSTATIGELRPRLRWISWRRPGPPAFGPTPSGSIRAL